MARKTVSRRWLLTLAMLLSVLGGVVGVWQINTTLHAHAASSTSSLPYHMTANGPYHVQGNTILDAQGQTYLFHGMGRDGMEYSCTGDGPLDAQHLAYMGAGASSSSATYWWGNTVRLPISEGFWLHGDAANGCSAAQYQTMVRTTISTLNALGLNAMLDLQWVDAGGHSPGAGSSWPAPDADSLTFWQQAATLYKNTPNVLFEVYNEPSISSWTCWKSGCSVTSTTYADSCNCHITATYQTVGMQALINAIRATGATNLLLIAGLNYGFDLSGVSAAGLTDSSSNIVYDTHPYPYQGKDTAADWDASFGNLSATVPVISAESGEYDCNNTFMSSLLSYFDSHQMGWIGWAWTVQGTSTSVCGYPQTITDYQGTPAPTMGQAEYQHLLNYVPAGTQPPAPISSNPAPSTPPGPVQATWYFAEGRVGKGFREYMTIENPSGNVCSAVLSYNYTPDNGNPTNKSITVTINPYSRLTGSVNSDLGYSDSSSNAAIVATVVNVNTAITPACTGVVAGAYVLSQLPRISSGTDILGATHLSATYTFADVPSTATDTSYLTILNTNNTSVTVTATYFANGSVAGTQTTTVPANARGTISPGAIVLPAHVAAVVTASQPIVVERPTYFSGMAVATTSISGAYDIAGTSTLANDWLFAEGYTSAASQEYLTIANVDSAQTTANVVITLKSKTGVTHTFPVTVGAHSQLTWDVNASNTFTGASPEVSAEVVSTGAQIVVQREMYFAYHHTLTTGRSTTALGGTDVMGQVGPAAYHSYSFAEGYANTGYNDWLTIQNPSTNAESISITLVNGLGQSYVQSVSVAGNARFTEDMASLVQSVFHAGTNSSANSFSMTVQTLSNGGVFVAERPLYINTQGSSFAIQGGDDIIGYVGA